VLLRAIINSIESVAPRSAQEEWDNSGMQVGDTGRDIQSVLLTTDITEAVVTEAVERGCQLIISHHPLLFHGLSGMRTNAASSCCRDGDQT
jgi:putative NIF3 family GTP cyclohydrolase 1 type 2